MVLVLVLRGLGLAGLVLFCEKRSCRTRRHNDLEGHSNFSSTIYSFSVLCFITILWRSTVVFTYLKVKSAKCLCLLPVVLVFVLLFWFWSWSCKQRSWSWSCYFGLDLGLKNLVLFTSLPRATKFAVATELLLYQPKLWPASGLHFFTRY